MEKINQKACGYRHRFLVKIHGNHFLLVSQEYHSQYLFVLLPT